MFKDYLQVLKLTVKAHKKFFVYWTSFQVALYIIYRLVQQSSDAGSTQFFGSSTFFAFCAVYAASYFIFIAYLGIFFHTWRKKSWLRLLPFSGLTLSLPPSSLILLVGTLFYLLHLDFWSGLAQQMGASVVEFVFLIPFIFYYSIRSFRSSFIGACVGLLLNMGLLFLHLTILWEWKTAHLGFHAELFYALALGLICITLEKECKAHIQIISAVVLIFTMIPLSFPFLRQPASLERAVLELGYYATPASVANYKEYVTNRDLWKSTPAKYTFNMRTIKLLSQEQARKYLTDEERTKFLSLLIEFQENFAYKAKSKAPFAYSDPFPLNRSEINSLSKQYLLENWKDEEAFCYFVPREIEEDILNKVFNSKYCLEVISDLIWHKPFPNPDPVKAALFESYLKRAHDEFPKEISMHLGNLFANAADFPSEKKEWLGMQNWFRTRAISDDALKLINEYTFLNYKKRIRKLLALPREKFTAKLYKMAKARQGYNPEVFHMLQHMCLYISDKCDGDTPKSEKQHVFKIFKRRLRSKSTKYGSSAEKQYQLIREILDEKHWPKLKRLKI